MQQNHQNWYDLYFMQSIFLVIKAVIWTGMLAFVSFSNTGSSTFLTKADTVHVVHLSCCIIPEDIINIYPMRMHWLVQTN